MENNWRTPEGKLSICMFRPSGFANWPLGKFGSYLPTGTERLAWDGFQILAKDISGI